MSELCKNSECEYHLNVNQDACYSCGYHSRDDELNALRTENEQLKAEIKKLKTDIVMLTRGGL